MGTILVSLSFMENAGNMASKFIFEIAYKEMHDLLAWKFQRCFILTYVIWKIDTKLPDKEWFWKPCEPCGNIGSFWKPCGNIGY